MIRMLNNARDPHLLGTLTNNTLHSNSSNSNNNGHSNSNRQDRQDKDSTASLLTDEALLLHRSSKSRVPGDFSLS